MVGVFAVLQAAEAEPKQRLIADNHDLRVGVLTNFDVLNPIFQRQVNQSFVIGFMLRGLSAPDRDWVMQCVLCTSLPTKENNQVKTVNLQNKKIGLDVTFKIKDDIFWGDGVQVTSDDFIFTYKVEKELKELGVLFDDDLVNALSVTKIDKLTFTIRYPQVVYNFDNVQSIPLPAHLEEPIFNSLPDKRLYPQKTLYAQKPATPGLWFGPYLLSFITETRDLVLKKNPYWHGEKPSIEQIRLTSYKTNKELLDGLMKSEVDTGAINYRNVRSLIAESRTRFEFAIRTSIAMSRLQLNVEVPFLSDRRIRQAMMLALDRQALGRLYDGELSTIADSFLHPDDHAFDPNIQRWKPNLARAGQLLEQAGFNLGPDGMRQNAEGKRLHFVFSSSNEDGPATREIIDTIVQSWHMIGIDVEIRRTPEASFETEIVFPRKFDIFLNTFVTSPEDVPFFTKEDIPTAQNNYSGWNISGFYTDETERVIAQLKSELDPVARLPLWRRLQAIYAEELPEIPLFFSPDMMLIPRWLEGISLTGHTIPASWQAEHWKIR